MAARIAPPTSEWPQCPRSHSARPPTLIPCACTRSARLSAADAPGTPFALQRSIRRVGVCGNLAGLLRRQRDEDGVCRAEPGRDLSDKGIEREKPCRDLHSMPRPEFGGYLGNHDGVNVAQAAAEPESGGDGAPREGTCDQRRGRRRDEDEDEQGDTAHLWDVVPNGPYFLRGVSQKLTM